MCQHAAVANVTTAVDIYSFGMCALEVRGRLEEALALSRPFLIRICAPSHAQMAVLEIQSNGDSSYVSQEAINSAIQSLEDPLQRVSEGRGKTSGPVF